MLIFKKAKTPFEKVFKGASHYWSWFFEPLTTLIKKNFSQKTILTKVKIFQDFYFFNFEESIRNKKKISEVGKKEIERVLEGSQQKFQYLVENINDIIFHLDKTGKVIYISPAIKNITGYSQEEIIGRSFSKFIHPEDLQKVKERFWAAFLGDVGSFEFRIIKKDSSVGYFYSSGHLLNPKSQKLGIVSALVDITENRKTEEKLRESERRYRYIYENAPFGIFQTTVKGKLLRANPSFAKILKYNSPDELIAETNKTNVAKHLFVDPRCRHELVKKVMSHKGWHTFENLYKCKNGQIICAQILLRSIEESLNREMEGFLVDITEKKKAEKDLSESQQKYQELVENINDVIFHLDNEGRFVYISPAIKRVAGYDPEEVIGHSFEEFVFSEDFPEAKEKLKLALSGKLKPRELRIVKKDGSVAHISSFGRPLIKEGKVEGVISVLTDITERKKAEEILMESYKYLGTVNRQFSVLVDLNKIIEEKDEKKVINFIVWTALEASNSKLAALYEYQNEKRAFKMISVASRDKISEEEKSKISHLTIISSKCQDKIDETRIKEIENIEDCFKEEKLINFKKKQKIKNFKILPIINKHKLKGILLLGFSDKKGDIENVNNFYDVFSKYVGFILTDIGIFR